MAWNYRKRITIAPGVRLNISKKGVSSTFGVRGASINVGQNGTYLNTGIPGTGIYSRRKIVSGGSNSQSSQSNKSNYNGCGITTLIFLTLGLFLILSQDFESPGLLFFGCVGVGVFLDIIVNLIIDSAKKVEQSIQSQIEIAKNALNQATNPIQKEILQNFISCTELSRKANETEAIIEALKKKIEKKTNSQLEEQLEKYEAELSKTTAELDEVQLDADKDLDDVEKWQYSVLCENFEKILLSKKIWLITSSIRNTELKSAAANTVERKEVNFDAGVFNYIKSSFDIPILRDLSGNIYYIYPRYIIKSQSFTNFEVFPIDAINLRYSKQRFIEDGVLPEDSHVVDYTYQYVNKNGGPDKRFSYNPRLPIVEYGKIEIEEFGLTYYVSDYFVADSFVNTYNLWRNRKTDEKSHTEEITESYFNMINNSVERIIDFYNLLKEEHSFQSVMKENVRFNIIMNGTEVTNASEQILSLFWADVIKCYMELGHPIDLNKKEGLGLLLFMSRTMGLDTVRYTHLAVFSDNLIKSTKDFINQIKVGIDSLTIPKNKFVISEILGEYDVELQKKYFVLLYRFSSITAKADSTVTEVEQKWLSELLKLSDINDETTKFEVLEDESISFLDELDPMFEDAARLIVAHQQGSTSLIQRKLTIGYNRAGRIIDQLETSGIVGVFDGVNARQVLIKNEYELETLLKKLISKPTTKTIKQQKEKSERLYPILKSNSQTELKSLIGLSSVKTEIETLTNFIKIQQERQSKGLKTSQPSYHCVFTGNPGTGKTTVARIVAEIYKELGILKKGHLVETDRSGLVAEYVGQTAVKTNKIIDTALDGVLFIDKAYSLISNSENDYGKEAIATLLKRMEDNRDRLVVVLAGYTAEMQKFIDSNPGLQSRFNRYIEFPDYSDEELFQIFELNLKQFDYALAEDVKNPLQEFLTQTVVNKDKNFGNARFIRNLFEKTIERQANRLSKEVNLTNEKLSEICFVDIPCK
jgi:AAA+ superfamily predicted ATPase